MCCLEVSKRRHLCVVVGAPAQLPRLVEDLESLCWRTSDLDPEGWSTGSTGNGINRSENPSLPLAPQIFPSGDTQSSQSSRDQTPSWMQVWPGLWEYLRLALPCVAMLAVEWWSFDPQINIYRMIQFQRSHVFLWHFGCSGTGGTYGRLFPFTRNLSAEAMGFGDFQLWNLSLFLRRWTVGVMGRRGDESGPTCCACHCGQCLCDVVCVRIWCAEGCICIGWRPKQKLKGIMANTVYKRYFEMNVRCYRKFKKLHEIWTTCNFQL